MLSQHSLSETGATIATGSKYFRKFCHFLHIAFILRVLLQFRILNGPETKFYAKLFASLEFCHRSNERKNHLEAVIIRF